METQQPEGSIERRIEAHGLGQFVGAIHFEGDPVKVQKEMRREKR